VDPLTQGYERNAKGENKEKRGRRGLGRWRTGEDNDQMGTENRQKSDVNEMEGEEGIDGVNPRYWIGDIPVPYDEVGRE